MPIDVIEPHPSVPQGPQKKACLSTGRGGAGNFSSHSASSLTPGPTAKGPAFRLSIAASKAPALQQQKQASQTRPAPSSHSTTGTGSSKPKYTSGGIGGAGNFVPAAERRIFSFDEELEREQRMEDARSRTPVVHFGRGGAGNFAGAAGWRHRGDAASLRGGSGSSSSSASVTSSEAGAARLSSRFGKMVRALSTSRE